MSSPLRPEDVMPDDRSFAEINGVTVRKGTAGAFFANVRALNGLAVDSPEREALTVEVRHGVAALRDLGVFEVFAFRSQDLADLCGVP
jgi:hypothetical protein